MTLNQWGMPDSVIKIPGMLLYRSNEIGQMTPCGMRMNDLPCQLRGRETACMMGNILINHFMYASNMGILFTVLGFDSC